MTDVYSFRVRLVNMELINTNNRTLWPPPNAGRGGGKAEANERRRAFAQRNDEESIVVEIDRYAAYALENELELDSDGPAYAFYRYSVKEHRLKTKPIGGNTLGDIGEMLVYLLQRHVAQDTVGRKVIRVVSYEPWQKEGRFPQPDFLMDINGYNDLRALEVKSHDAFNFIELDNALEGQSIGACDGVATARKEALPQLGYDDNLDPIQIQHFLKTKRHGVLPFPVMHGVAAAVLTRDARISRIQHQHEAGVRQYLAKRPCTSKRECWDCFSDDHGPFHAVVAELHNEPGALLLVRVPPPPGWMTAYHRWAASLRDRDVRAVHASTKQLVSQVFEWLNSIRGQEQLVMWFRHLWGHYLIDNLVARSIPLYDMAQIVPIPDPAQGDPSWPLLQRAQEEIVLVAWEEIVALRPLARLTPMEATIDLEHGLGTAALSITAEGWTLRYTSSAWWDSRDINMAGAADVWKELLNLALKLSGVSPDTPLEYPVGWGAIAPVYGTVQGARVPLGWRVTPFAEAPVWAWDIRGLRAYPSWLRLIVFGDCRATAFIWPDGRSLLRVVFEGKSHPEAIKVE